MFGICQDYEICCWFISRDLFLAEHYCKLLETEVWGFFFQCMSNAFLTSLFSQFFWSHEKLQNRSYIIAAMLVLQVFESKSLSLMHADKLSKLYVRGSTATSILKVTKNRKN